ncbi:MAG: protein-L-isoaspartate(D-aspartate) O-methyltransferase [Myxococcota bacterium]
MAFEGVEGNDEARFRERRLAMVQSQLRRRGIRDERVLEAFAAVPRHLFVPDSLRESAYADGPLPIGHGQTISQPLMIALMLDGLNLRGDERVLDVGSGSGYQAALLAHMAREVVSIEVVPELVQMARRNLERAGITNVEVIEGDGSVGYAPRAPYDAIVVAAGSPDVPQALVDQLAEDGRLVIPVGPRYGQSCHRLRKRQGRIQHEDLGACAFVPLVGEGGWAPGR